MNFRISHLWRLCHSFILDLEFGPMTLYFGCRQAALDDIYGPETSQLKEESILTNVYTALSREVAKPKVIIKRSRRILQNGKRNNIFKLYSFGNILQQYVQDILKQNGRTVYKQIVHDGGHFYVCGDVSMAAGVTKTVQNILQELGGFGEQKAKDYLLKMKVN